MTLVINILEGKSYKIKTNNCIVTIIKLYYINEIKVCFYGKLEAKDGGEMVRMEFHLNLDKLKHWEEYGK